MVEVSLTIALAFLAFLIAEHYLHVSGVMAVVTAALVIGSHGRTSVSGHGWELLEETWETLGFWANSLIFILVGIAVPTYLSDFGPEMWVTLLTLLVVGFGARALLTHGILPILRSTGICPPVNLGFRTVMWWGGLRGAVSLALALAVVENPAITQEVKNFIIALVCAFVLFTLFINATTVGAVMKAFGLDKLSKNDLAVRDRTVGKALKEVAEGIPVVASNNTIFEQVADLAVTGYNNRLSAIEKSVDSQNTIDADSWLKIGLLSVIGQERKHYFSDYGNGYVDPSNTRDLVSTADDLLDAVKENGFEGYKEAWERTLEFDWRVRLAMYLQRKFSIVGPLKMHLANRWARLRSMLSALNKIKNGGLDELQTLIGARVNQRLAELVDERIKKTETALNALRAQYPDYANKVQTRHLDKITLNQELSKYKELYNDAIISTEIFVNLETDLKTREDLASEEPELDLGLNRIDLVSAVPLFENVDGEKRQSIANLLRPRVVVPGEIICKAGDAGASMFFISSGALSVQLESGSVTLGSGEFFGEIALLRDTPRVATVAADSFCELLVLRKQEFDGLLAKNPQLKDEIEKVAEDRLS